MPRRAIFVRASGKSQSLSSNSKFGARPFPSHRQHIDQRWLQTATEGKGTFPVARLNHSSKFGIEALSNQLSAFS